jgi:hypothetical protein
MIAREYSGGLDDAGDQRVFVDAQQRVALVQCGVGLLALAGKLCSPVLDVQGVHDLELCQQLGYVALG